MFFFSPMRSQLMWWAKESKLHNIWLWSSRQSQCRLSPTQTRWTLELLWQKHGMSQKDTLCVTCDVMWYKLKTKACNRTRKVLEYNFVFKYALSRSKLLMLQMKSAVSAFHQILFTKRSSDRPDPRWPVWKMHDIHNAEYPEMLSSKAGIFLGNIPALTTLRIKLV